MMMFASVIFIIQHQLHLDLDLYIEDAGDE
jgi:hypothetical protein